MSDGFSNDFVGNGNVWKMFSKTEKSKKKNNKHWVCDEIINPARNESLRLLTMDNNILGRLITWKYFLFFEIRLKIIEIK